MTWRVLVVDDERPARAKVVRLLADDARVAVVGEACDGIEALESIDTLQPDIVVLDIQMPGLNGFEVIEALGAEATCTVVFSTAYDQHALRAFDAHAVDYLLKPYDAVRLKRALDKAITQCAGRLKESHGALVSEVLGDKPSQITLKTVEGRWVTFEVAQVQSVTADNKHTTVAMLDGLRHRARRSLRDLCRLLEPRLVRVHRSTLVNAAAVVAVEPLDHSDALLTLADGSSAILSRTYRATFMERWRAQSSPR